MARGMGCRISRRIAVVVVGLLSGCVLVNPGHGDGEAGSASSDGPTTVTSPTGMTGITETTATTTSTGSTAGGSGSTTASTYVSATTGGESSTTGSSGSESSSESESGSSTGDLNPACSENMTKLLVLDPTENTYVVTGPDFDPDKSCQWTDSNHVLINPGHPCALLNFGASAAKYTLIGESEGSRGEYLVRFGVHKAMQENPGWTIAEARIEIVPWWDVDRTEISFDVGIVNAADPWVPGEKNGAPAMTGDSSWESHRITNIGHPWKSGDGPSAGGEQAATIELDFLGANTHPTVQSSAIPGSMLNPWVEEQKSENGFVISTKLAPILVKNKDTEYAPKLHLVICPK